MGVSRFAGAETGARPGCLPTGRHIRAARRRVLDSSPICHYGSTMRGCMTKYVVLQQFSALMA
jgi:hypothetical protein